MKKNIIEIRASLIIVYFERINDYQDEINKIQKYLSIWDEVCFKYTNFACFIHEKKEGNYLIVPRGMGTLYLTKLFPTFEVIDKRFHHFYKPRNTDFNLKFPPKNPEQEDVIAFLKNQGQYGNLDCNQKLIALDTGKGKTYCTINYLKFKQEVAMIIVHQLTIIDQWKRREFLRLTDMTEKNICVIKDSNHLAKLVEKPSNHYIYLVTHKTLVSYANDDLLKLSNVMKALRIGIKVYDEAHKEIRSILKIDCHTNVPETIYLTATPNRSDFKEDKVYGTVFQYVTKYFDKGEAESYHKIVYVQINTDPNEIQENFVEKSNKYGFNLANWCSYIKTNRDKYKYFKKVLMHLLHMAYKGKNQPKKLAIIVGTLALAEDLTSYFRKKFPEKKVVDFTTNNTKKVRNEIIANKDYEIMVTTEKSFSNALNVMDLECIICTASFGSQITTRQLTGRLRNSTESRFSVYIDITDYGFTSCCKQLASRKKVLNERAKKVYKMDLTNLSK
jgi:superfamily II DNA or RNA helicase